MTDSRSTAPLEAMLAKDILQLIPDGLVVIDTEQTIVHINSAAEEIFQTTSGEVEGDPLDVLLPPEIVEPHRRYVREFLESESLVHLLHENQPLTARRSNGESFSFRGTITKLQGQHGVHLALLMREVTEYVRLENVRLRSERALTALTQCLEAAIQSEDEQSLLREICRIAVETQGYPFAWVGYALRDEARTVEPRAWAGAERNYLGQVHISWANNAYGRGPAGRAVRSGEPQIFRNLARDPDFGPWREPALERGFRVCASFPLRLRDSVLGVLTLYSEEDAFDDREIELLSKLADNLAFSIDAIRTRKQRDEDAARLQQRTYTLNERLKELNLLSTLSRIQSREDLNLRDTLFEILQALPPAWQFPDHAAARISVEGLDEISTPSFSTGPYSMREGIPLLNREIGEVEVVYSQLPEGVDETAPFLPEERELLQAVASRLGEIVGNHAVREERRKLSIALEQAADAVIITDREGTVEYVNPAFEVMSGYARKEALGRSPSILKSGEHPDDFYANLWRTILAGEVFHDTLINRSKDGTLYYEDKTISPLYDARGNLSHFLSTGKDITQRLQTESRLRYLATHDPLTGLINHSEFIEQLNESIGSLPERRGHIAVAVIGLDNFRSVNETLGRTMGDQVLRNIAHRLAGLSENAVARAAGDVFAMQIHEESSVNIARFVERLLAEMARPVVIEGDKVTVTASAGVSWYPDDSRQGLQLVQKAETAMSLAKAEGAHRFRFYTSDMQARSQEHLRLTKDLLDALEKREFSVYYQPQIDLHTGRPAGAEALARWFPSPDVSVPPDSFIPILEEIGMIRELGEFVLGTACDACRRMQSAGFELPRISVNISGIQLQDPEFVDRVSSILRNADLAPHNLELEITESVLITYYEAVQYRLEELKELGVGVALDDFGTGYSSLQYLTRYPFSRLKIDKAFVWQMATSKKDWEVIKAIVSLGNILGINVTAEGAETEKHLQDLRNIGCDSVQGYYYSPAIPEERFREFLKSFG